RMIRDPRDSHVPGPVLAVRSPGWYTSPVPHRRQARPLHGPPSAARFLPPQPVADRDRGRGILGRLGRRSLAVAVVAVAIAVPVPLAFAALGPSAATLPAPRWRCWRGGLRTPPGRTRDGHLEHEPRSPERTPSTRHRHP